MCVCVPDPHYQCSLTADAINNAAGFGFNGYDVDGSPQWDLISNLRIMDIEVGLVSVLFLSQDIWDCSNGLLFVLFSVRHKF